MKTVDNPFFSIIIPCYNSKKTIGRLLKSIVNQNMSNEIQVILSDDHSTESYDNEIRPYNDKLCIDRTVTDYNCCPGNTREKGVSLAKGTWIAFADHDDVFLPNIFREVKKQILKNNEQYMAFTNIYRARNTDGMFNKSLIEMQMTTFTGLLHGKFFNRENFWNKYDLHFKKDMFTHEDTYLTSVAKCALRQANHDALHIDEFTYVWFNNSKSLSNRDGIRTFLEEHFHYYMEGTSAVFREYYEKGLVDDQFTVYHLIRSFLYEYFYIQLFLFHNPEHYVKENVAGCKKDLKELKRMFNLKNIDIFWYCGDNNALLFSQIQREVGLGYIPNYSLMEWMNILDKDN